MIPSSATALSTAWPTPATNGDRARPLGSKRRRRPSRRPCGRNSGYVRPVVKSTVPSVGAAGVDVRQRLVFSGIVCRLPCHGLRDLSGADAPRRSPLGQGLRCRRPRGCQCSCSGRLGSRGWAGSHAARGARRPAPASRGRCRLRTGGTARTRGGATPPPTGDGRPRGFRRLSTEDILLRSLF